MGVNLSGRSFLRLLDFSTEEIEYLLALSKNFKDLKRTGTPHRYLEGKNIVLLFQKTSTRTRCSFEVGGMDLGMGVTYLDPGSSQMGKKESIEDTARVLGRMYDGIEFRGFKQTDVEELAEKSGVPVWNGLTDLWHPTQMLADILTVQENFNYDIKGKTLVFMGDAKHPDRAGELQLRHQGQDARLHGRRQEQRGALADGRLRQAWHELCGVRPQELLARR